MTNDRTKNPYFPSSELARAWEKGYAAALSDAAGIAPKPNRREFGARDIIR